jgi:hypothetical protein
MTESVSMNEAVTMNAQPIRSVIPLSMQMYDDSTVLESERPPNVSMLRASAELIFGQKVADMAQGRTQAHG